MNAEDEQQEKGGGHREDPLSSSVCTVLFAKPHGHHRSVH